jgi:serine protease Do
MKTTWMMKFAALAFAAALVVPVSLLAQEDKGDKGDKGSHDKVKKDVQQIIVTRTGDKSEKVVIEVVGDKVTINGKPLEDYKDKDGDVSVKLHKLKDLEGYAFTPRVGGTWNFNDGDNIRLFSEDANRAMLGVTTDKTELGVEVNDVTKESAAEKIGLKPGDVITKVDDVKIETPDDLSKAIKKHKPGDKVTVTYLRDKKEQKATAELSKWKGVDAYGLGIPGQNFKFDMGDNFPRALTIPRVPGQSWSWSGGSPKLGLSVQDTDDGKGVKVIEVDDESNAAKAGIHNDDVITEVDGKAVNGTDDMVKMIKESKEKTSVMIKLLRGGKVQNVEVKMPRRIKTADL